MIRVSIVGATGYVGIELVRLLSEHKEVKLVHLVANSSAGQEISEMYPQFAGIVEGNLCTLCIENLARDSDVIFTSLPHGTSGEVIPALFDLGAKVIDLSGDFRYKDVDVYNTWYKTTHPRPDVLAKAVYGLPELHRGDIAKAQLIGNPGCYTTCSILSLAPILSYIDLDSITIDAKSGVTGAGKAPSQALHFCEVMDSMKAYGLTNHRHTSEIEQELSLVAGQPVALSFNPHLLPIKRGILTTCYAKLTRDVDAQTLLDAYNEKYNDEPFVTVYPLGKLPELKHVVGSNRVCIGLAVDTRLSRVIIVSCIDNLIKGAAGQAVQNMNLLFGLEETMALSAPAWYL